MTKQLNSWPLVRSGKGCGLRPSQKLAVMKQQLRPII